MPLDMSQRGEVSLSELKLRMLKLPMYGHLFCFFHAHFNKIGETV
jgi:hypothetical protein